MERPHRGAVSFLRPLLPLGHCHGLGVHKARVRERRGGRWCAGVLALPCGGFGNAPSHKVERGRADYDTSTECYDQSTLGAGPVHRGAAGRAPLEPCRRRGS